MTQTSKEERDFARATILEIHDGDESAIRGESEHSDICYRALADADRCAELEGYLQQAKDDYELALKEIERLRAGLNRGAK